jgi:hypothetical protein
LLNSGRRATRGLQRSASELTVPASKVCSRIGGLVAGQETRTFQVLQYLKKSARWP